MTAPVRLNHRLIERLRAGDRDAALAVADILGRPAQVDKLAASDARYDVLREAAASLSSAMSVNGKAVLINRAITNYRAGGWQRESHLEQCPPRLRGLERYVWRALCLYDADVSVRQLRKKLAPTGGGGQRDGL